VREGFKQLLASGDALLGRERLGHPAMQFAKPDEISAMHRRGPSS